MLLYLLFWTILGFIFHFYIIFGTNLLTGGLAQICCFMPISVFRRKGISDGVETERNQLEKLIFGTKATRWTWTPCQGRKEELTRVGGAPLASWALVAPLTCFFCLYNSTYPKTSRTHNRSGVPPPEASVATENQSRPVSAPSRRGQCFSGGHLHHPGALHDEEGVVLPRG